MVEQFVDSPVDIANLLGTMSIPSEGRRPADECFKPSRMFWRPCRGGAGKKIDLDQKWRVKEGVRSTRERGILRESGNGFVEGQGLSFIGANKEDWDGYYQKQVRSDRISIIDFIARLQLVEDPVGV